MSFSTTYIAVIVGILAEALKLVGVEVGSEELTTTALVLVQLVSAVWVLIERFKKGGVNFWGLKK